MKKTLILTVAVCMMIAAGCSMMGQKASQSIVGTWKGEMPQMGDITMTFKDDMTVDVVIEGGMAMEMSGKYSIDYNADPITLDQFDFEDSMMGDMRYESIVKFVDSNTLMVAGDPNGRPTSFDMAIEMKRQ